MPSSTLSPVETERLSEALIDAAKRGALSEAESLLAQGADPTRQQSLALTEAARAGRLDCLRLLLPVSDPRAGDFNALNAACGQLHLECVAALLTAIPLEEGPPPALLQALRERTLLEGFFSAPNPNRPQIAGLLEAHLEAMELVKVANAPAPRAPGAPRV